MVPGPIASALSSGNLEIQIYRPYHGTAESETLGWSPGIHILAVLWEVLTSALRFEDQGTRLLISMNHLARINGPD